MLSHLELEKYLSFKSKWKENGITVQSVVSLSTSDIMNNSYMSVPMKKLES